MKKMQNIHNGNQLNAFLKVSYYGFLHDAVL